MLCKNGEEGWPLLYVHLPWVDNNVIHRKCQQSNVITGINVNVNSGNRYYHAPCATQLTALSLILNQQMRLVIKQLIISMKSANFENCTNRILIPNFPSLLVIFFSIVQPLLHQGYKNILYKHIVLLQPKRWFSIPTVFCQITGTQPFSSHLIIVM